MIFIGFHLRPRGLEHVSVRRIQPPALHAGGSKIGSIVAWILIAGFISVPVAVLAGLVSKNGIEAKIPTGPIENGGPASI